MVTQAIFDRSMEELRAKLDELTMARRNTDLRLQQEAEHTSQRFAQQDPTLVTSGLQKFMGAQDRVMSMIREDLASQI
jgi:hypothetical protein